MICENISVRFKLRDSSIWRFWCGKKRRRLNNYLQLESVSFSQENTKWRYNSIIRKLIYEHNLRKCKSNCGKTSICETRNCLRTWKNRKTRLWTNGVTRWLHIWCAWHDWNICCCSHRQDPPVLWPSRPLCTRPPYNYKQATNANRSQKDNPSHLINWRLCSYFLKVCCLKV